MGRHAKIVVLGLASAAVLAGCGGSKSSSGGGGAGALSAEAKSAATGDIPDNQVFLTFRNPAAGYSMSYPEGWARSGSGSDITFRDKNNIVHVTVAKGSAPTAATVAAELVKERSASPTLNAGAPRPFDVKGKRTIKVTYTTRSAPNAVTGRRVTLTVDRYVLAHGGRVATVDLGTPVGVDNVDAYRMMIESFRWQ